MKLLTRGEIIKAIKEKFPGIDPEMDIDFEATRLANQSQAKLTHSEIVKWLKERNHSFEGRLYIIKIDFDEWSDFQEGNYELSI